MRTRIRDDGIRCVVMSLLLGCVVAPGPASATVTISNGPNQNIKCSGGLCYPTAKTAVLNVKKLERMLAYADVKITTGSGNLARKVNDIVVAKGLSWSNTTTLYLDAFRSVEIDRVVAVTGTGGLNVVTDDGGVNGTFSFGSNGAVQFPNLTNFLSINGATYELVSSVGSLASAIAANPAGNYALADNYDASGDGTYQFAAIPTAFGGNFDGLGNRITNLSISDSDNQTVDDVGMFATIVAGGSVSNVDLINVTVTALTAYAGGLVGDSAGNVMGSYASGSVSGNLNEVLGGLVGSNEGRVSGSYSDADVTNGILTGGLVGINNGDISRCYTTGAAVVGFQAGGLTASNEGTGTIELSYSSAQVYAEDKEGALGGGLAGENVGKINQSFAVGAVSGGGGSLVGGLIGENFGTVSQAYATGSASGSGASYVGGFLGADNGGTISEAYSTGAVTNGNGGYSGGFVGFDNTEAGSIQNAYWDTDSSGITNPAQGAGNISNDSGITGLSTAQFQSGLPDGFKKRIWTEKAAINGGFPYLKAVPPAK